MLYSMDGRPLHEALSQAALAFAERKDYRRPQNYVFDGQGQRVFQLVRDKIGDIIRVYRVLHQHQPGHGYAERKAVKRAS